MSCFCFHRKQKLWFDACRNGQVKYINEKKQLNYNKKYKQNGSEFDQFTGSMFASFFDKVEILKILMDKEYTISKTHHYITIDVFRLAPNSNLLHIALLKNSQNCLHYILRKMRKNIQIRRAMNQKNNMNLTTLHLMNFAYNEQCRDLIFQNMDLFMDEFSNKQNNILLFTIKQLDIEMFTYFLNISAYEQFYQSIKQCFDQIDIMKLIDYQMESSRHDQLKILQQFKQIATDYLTNLTKFSFLTTQMVTESKYNNNSVIHTVSSESIINRQQNKDSSEWKMLRCDSQSDNFWYMNNYHQPRKTSFDDKNKINPFEDNEVSSEHVYVESNNDQLRQQNQPILITDIYNGNQF